MEEINMPISINAREFSQEAETNLRIFLKQFSIQEREKLLNDLPDLVKSCLAGEASYHNDQVIYALVLYGCRTLIDTMYKEHCQQIEKGWN